MKTAHGNTLDPIKGGSSQYPIQGNEGYEADRGYRDECECKVKVVHSAKRPSRLLKISDGDLIPSWFHVRDAMLG
jgi:hypothetical protein